MHITRWELHDFLSLIYYVKSISEFLEVKWHSAISTHLEALNFDFYEFFHIWRPKFTKWTIFRAPKIAKMAVLGLLDSPKLISRKIWLIEKSWNFHTVILKWCVDFYKNSVSPKKVSVHWYLCPRKR